MALKHLFKLEKLKIGVFGNRLRAGLPQKSFEVMFNPTSFSMKHENVFEKGQGMQSSGNRAIYSHSPPEGLDLELVFDGSGVTDFGIATLIGKGSDSVTKQVKDFLTLCFYMDGELHEPRFLRIEWGDGPLQSFDCRLKSATIKYVSFDKSGAPLRAEVSTNFVEDIDPAKRIRQEGKSSPDLSHSRIVKSGDTLPLLCKEIYGSSHHYLRVAQVNQLDDFRDLNPGQEIHFPPFEG